jgi:putative oxidoreductase
MTPLQTFAGPVGRVLLALIFLTSGVGKIFSFDGTAQYMASQGMPMASVFLVAAIAIEVLGALSIITGFKARWGATSLIVFTIVASLVFHQFWNLEGMDRQIQMIMFMKNLSMIGGLLLVIAFGPGRFAVESRSSLAPAAA